MTSSLESEKKTEPIVSSGQGATQLDPKQLDAAAELVAGEEKAFDVAEEKRVRRKIDLHVMPLMCVLYWVQFMDKTTLGSSAILGIREATHLTTNEYNWLGTIFYLSYLCFEFPQNIGLQQFPVGKWMSINIFIWAVALCCHAACTNFAGLFVVRFILGACEGSITAGFMIVTSSFYTRPEQTVRTGYWFLMNGLAQIISGFISFGTLHIKTPGFQPWQWLMIITGMITLTTAISYWFLFPDSPANAWFLTREERIIAIQRIKANQTGIGNKTFKKQQMIEAFKDPKTWLFALYTALANIPNSLTNQRSIIVSSFGFTNLQTTLLGCVDGIIEIVTILTGVIISSRIKDSRAFVGSISVVPSILGALLVSLLPWSNKIGLLFGIWLTGIGSPSFVLALAWISCVTAGHTKRVTTNATILVAYAIGNTTSQFMWQERYKPRNRIPWIIIIMCYLANICLLLTIRFYLGRENQKRNRSAAMHDGSYEDVYIEKILGDGTSKTVRVEKEYRDLTDHEDQDFRYVL